MKPEKLRTSQQFRRVYDHGRRFHTPYFSVFILNHGESARRIGITVTRKVGGAVVRNRCKRRLREVIRQYLREAAGRGVEFPGFDMVINVRSAFIDAGFDELRRSFSEVIERYLGSQANRPAGEAQPSSKEER